ncbi:hypothetical protein D3C71_77950 [compost metagenome]
MLRLTIIAAVVLLAGCGTTQPIIQYKNVLLSPPDSLLQDCRAEEPPERELYNAAAWTEKERLLFTHAGGQMKNLDLCNVDKRALRKWKADQVRMIEEKEKK